MSERERYARSFGPVAEEYERSRPPYADDALDWVASRLPLRDVLDLAAGTGKLTRQLLERAAHVVAVEPDPDMRATFARVLPGVEIVDGRAEAIPLPDGAVDVVAVGQAFHWFGPEAPDELHRVTRPGGGVALLWNVWSEDDPVLAAFEGLLAQTRTTSSEWSAERLDARFANREERRFRRRRTMSADRLEGWAASTSAFVMAPPDVQAAYRTRIREIVGGPEAEVTLTTLVVVADRRELS